MSDPIVYTGRFKVLQQIVDALNSGAIPDWLKCDPYDASIARHNNYAYIIGDYCMYEGNIYCYWAQYSLLADASNPPAFDPASWISFVDLFNELSSKPGRRIYNSGSGAISEIFNSAINVATGQYSHAEGLNTKATGQEAHAEGCNSEANGNYSHAEGMSCKVYGAYGHVEGDECVVGVNGYPYGAYASHAEGYGSKALGNYCHAEGYYTTAGKGADDGFKGYSHAEGYYTYATGQYSHAEGNYTKAYGNYCHAEGQNCEANGNYSHVEGSNSKTGANGYYAHAEGGYTQANNSSAHAEGYGTKADGEFSHAEGNNTQATAANSHAEGSNTKATGNTSHAEGFGSEAIGQYSHAAGYYTKTYSMYESAFGSYNDSADSRNDIANYNANNAYVVGDQVKRYVNGQPDGNIYQSNVDIAMPAGAFDETKWDVVGTYPTNTTLFSVGNGTYQQRSNAFEILKDGTCKVGGNEVVTKVQVPDPPTTDGVYTLQCTVSNGVPTYTWV